MYAFGDDRNPASDTVSVMEEILVEYILDLVSFLLSSFLFHLSTVFSAIQQPTLQPDVKHGSLLMICGERYRVLKTRNNLRVWRNYCSCKRISGEQGNNLRRRKDRLGCRWMVKNHGVYILTVYIIVMCIIPAWTCPLSWTSSSSDSPPCVFEIYAMNAIWQ